MGIVAGMMSGAGEGILHAGKQLGDYAAKSALQEEMAKITEARDLRLSELSEQVTIRGETRKRDQAAAVGAEAEAARTGQVDDLSGTVRPRTALEGSEAEAGVYRKHGLIEAAQRTQESERSRQERAEARSDGRSDRNADNARADKQFEELARHNQAVERIQAATAGRLNKSAELDDAVKQIALDNAKRIKTLDEEFATATPERKAQIRDERHMLTGKDKDKFLPVALKDETGAVTGYRIFDTTRGAWVDGGGGKPAAGKDGRPPLSSFRKGGAAPNAEPGSGAEAAPKLRPASGAGVSAYGPLTPWSTVEQQARAGDQAAIDYAQKRIAGGPGIIGVNPPESLIEFLKTLGQ